MIIVTNDMMVDIVFLWYENRLQDVNFNIFLNKILQYLAQIQV